MTQNGSYERFPAIDLNSNQQLNLQFDDMMPESDNYQFTFIHCSSDWKVSNLKPNEYLTGAMFENITNYTFSTTTFQVYTHYNVNFPSADMKPKLSGNYILKIFRNFDENDLILTHRFMVVDDKFVPEIIELVPPASTPPVTERLVTVGSVNGESEEAVIELLFDIVKALAELSTKKFTEFGVFSNTFVWPDVIAAIFVPAACVAVKGEVGTVKLSVYTITPFT
jgi:hypothetical protein